MFCFTSQDVIECVDTFKLDGHTTKREALISEFKRLGPLGVGAICMCI